MDPRPGDYLVIATGGFLGAVIRLGTRARYNHAAVVVEDGLAVEASVYGARLTPIAGSGWTLIADNAVEPRTEEQRAAVVAAARQVIGTPYGFLDIVALGLVALGLRWSYLEARVAREDRLICSQLVDAAYLRAGVHLFDDGRASQSVTPGDLADRLTRRTWEAGHG